jgi:5-methylcytosine-specific restriction endonuclease McrA
MQVMDLWLVAPSCYSCALDKSCDGDVHPFIEHRFWQEGIRDNVGARVLQRTKRLLGLDPDFAYRCKFCSAEVRPWQGDDMSVSHLHLEEHFHIPLEVPGRRNPPEAVRRLIPRLYGSRCFGCAGRSSPKRKLHIDHIIPRSRGGTSAFRNLQPLCDHCGDLKKDRMPEELEVYSTIFFGPYPSDSHEGFFW